MAVISQAKLPSDEHHWTLVMISQLWFRWHGDILSMKLFMMKLIRENKIRCWCALCLLYPELYFKTTRGITMHAWWIFFNKNPQHQVQVSCVVAAMLGTEPFQLQENTSVPKTNINKTKKTRGGLLYGKCHFTFYWGAKVCIESVRMPGHCCWIVCHKVWRTGWSPVNSSIWGQIHNRYIRHQPLELPWKVLTKIYFESPSGQC